MYVCICIYVYIYMYIYIYKHMMLAKTFQLVCIIFST